MMAFDVFKVISDLKIITGARWVGGVCDVGRG